MNASTDTRTRIIDRASELMMQHGFDGFSYRDISTELGMKNAAVHYHFPSKTDLVLALVEDQHEVLRSETSEFMAYGGSAREQLEGLFQFTAHQCTHGRPVCMVGAMAINYDAFPEEVKRANEQFLCDSRKWMTRVLEVGREQGEFEFKGEAEGKAIAILAALQGGRQLFRAAGKQFLEQLFGQIRSDLGIEA